MGLAARRGALLLSLWALCQLFADTAGQLAEIKPITFSSWHYSAPSGVFNPAAVFNPQRGWVMMFRWDRCFYAHCGVLHTQTAVCAWLPQLTVTCYTCRTLLLSRQP